jgi:hypothetical protein
MGKEIFRMNIQIMCQECGRIEYVSAPLYSFHAITQTIGAICASCLKKESK